MWTGQSHLGEGPPPPQLLRPVVRETRSTPYFYNIPAGTPGGIELGNLRQEEYPNDAYGEGRKAISKTRVDITYRAVHFNGRWHCQRRRLTKHYRRVLRMTWQTLTTLDMGRKVGGETGTTG